MRPDAASLCDRYEPDLLQRSSQHYDLTHLPVSFVPFFSFWLCPVRAYYAVRIHKSRGL
jgi:hypothetical protein